MRESEQGPKFDQWLVTNESTITLESPLTAIRGGHLDLYLEDPENAFGGLGIGINPPDVVIDAFHKCEQQGEKLHIHVVAQGARHDFILVYNPDAEPRPWRLVKKLE